MNRWDELKATALDIADWVCADPADRDRMANDLLKLCGLMIQAVGKGVAIDGEGDIGQGDHTCDDVDACAGDCDQTINDAKAHNRYLVGERIQDAAREAVAEAQSADLDRYARSGLKPAWVPSTGTAARARRMATQRPDSLAARAASAAAAFVSQDAVQDFPGPSVPVCTWIPGDAVPSCDWDKDCPAHGEFYAHRTLQQLEGSVTTLQTWDGQVLRTVQEGDVAATPATPAGHKRCCMAHPDAQWPNVDGTCCICGKVRDVAPATPVAPDAVRRSIHGTASAADVAAGRCDCGSRGGPCAPRA